MCIACDSQHIFCRSETSWKLLYGSSSWPLSKMTPGHLPSPKAWLNPPHSPASAVHDVYCSFALLNLSMETFGVASSQPGVCRFELLLSCSESWCREKAFTSASFFIPGSLFALLWVSILTSHLSCIQGTYFFLLLCFILLYCGAWTPNLEKSFPVLLTIPSSSQESSKGWILSKLYHSWKTSKQK